MTYAVIDVESTFFQKGNPFAERNRLCVVGVRINGVNEIIPVEYDPTFPYADSIRRLDDLIGSVDTVVLFNAKFDLNWLARYGVFLGDNVSVFDCQLAEFILGNQRTPYPSLDGCLAKYQLGSKLDVVAMEYWEQGIDTDAIPYPTLESYLARDLELTDALYQRLTSEIVAGTPRAALIRLHMQDLRVLQEMETNGILFAWDSLAETQRLTQKELDEIDSDILEEFVRPVVGTEVCAFNLESGDHLSALLYGGIIRVKRATQYEHTYKSGPKQGQTELRNKWRESEYTFPRLTDPIQGSALKKDGVWSVDEETLKSLRKPKALIGLLLKRAELAKLVQTYYSGIPQIRDKYDWKDGLIHGTFNQCRVITGRLASEKPNLQNFPDVMNQFIVSRYAD